MRKTKSIAVLALAGLLGSQANAAIVTANVTGSLDTFQWKWGLSQYQWNDFFAGSQAQFDAALAEGNTGYFTQRGTVNPFAMQLTGSITYDDVSGTVSALTVSQVGTLSGLRPISNLDFGFGAGPYKLYSTDPEITYSGFSWTLGSNGLGQTLELQGLDNLLGGPTVNSCVSHFITTNGACDDPQGFYRPFIGHIVGNGTGSADPLNSGDNALGNESLLDFDGIPAGFSPGGVATFANTPGATITILGTTVDIELFSQSGLLVDGGSSAGRGQMQLTIQQSVVPVPAAVWLFGSGLGLLGALRRRRVAAD
jgi:hypothetical protein